MKTWKIRLGVLLVFVCGLIIGSVATGLSVKYKVAQVIRGGSPAMTRTILRRLAWELRLKNDQKPAVEKTVVRMQEELRQLRAKYRPETEAIVRSGIDEIRAGLPADQQRRLDDYCAQLKSRWDLPMQ